MINPEITEKEGELVEVEACLSIPGFAGTVKRPERLTVSYLDLEGKGCEMMSEGFLAKAVCHEIDHLDGILFRDLVIEEVDLENEDEPQEDEEIL